MSERTPQDVLREDVRRFQKAAELALDARNGFAAEIPIDLYSAMEPLRFVLQESRKPIDKAIAEAPDSPPNPCAQALEELAQQDAVIDRLQIALRVASHQPHDQLGEPSGGFPVCSVCGAIQTAAPDTLSEKPGLDVERPPCAACRHGAHVRGGCVSCRCLNGPTYAEIAAETLRSGSTDSEGR